ncbi:MAG: NAD-binding protein [Desulfobacterales bacterium]|nr:NAD-binding protein [Desulfobacterales bacterium]
MVVIEQDSDGPGAGPETVSTSMTVEGNGSSPRVLEEAGVREADILIAVADIDEVNVVACLLAKEYGVATRIARVRDPDFSESDFLGRGKRLGIDLLINPNIVVAEEILDLIKTPRGRRGRESSRRESAHAGDPGLAESADPRPAAAYLSGRFHATTPFLIVAVLRHERLILPDGETVLQEGDHIYFVSRRESVNAILALLGKTESIAERVMVIGGGRMGLRVAQLLRGRTFQGEARRAAAGPMRGAVRASDRHPDPPRGRHGRPHLGRGGHRRDGRRSHRDGRRGDQHPGGAAGQGARGEEGDGADQAAATAAPAAASRDRRRHQPADAHGQRHPEVCPKGEGPLDLRDAGERCRDAGNDGDSSVEGRR